MPEYLPDDPAAVDGRKDARDLWREHHSVDVLALMEHYAQTQMPESSRRVYMHAARNELQVLLARSEGGHVR